jgi:hypothetical protein
MATTTLNTITRQSASEFLPRFKREFWEEWIWKNRFSRYMGTKNDMPIQFHYELKEGGQTIQFNLLRRIVGGGVGGNMLLEGREGNVGRDKCVIKVDYLREAIAVTKGDEKKSIVEILPKVKSSVLNFSKEKQRDRIIDAAFMVSPDVCLCAPLYNPDPTRVQVGDPSYQRITTIAGATEITTWLTNNRDRVMFGNSSGNWSTTFATAMAAISSNDSSGFTTKSVQAMKDMAANADPHIEPLRLGDEDEPYYVIFCDTKSFRQLQADADMKAANQYARAREGDNFKKNPIASGSDLIYDGCIIRQIPEMKPLIYDSGIDGSKADQALASGSGAWRGVLSAEASYLALTSGGIVNLYNDGTAPFTAVSLSGSTKAYGRAVLMGANAIGLAVGQEPEFPDQRRDYGFRKGLALEELYGCNKIQRQDVTSLTKYVDNATVTAFFNANV